MGCLAFGEATGKWADGREFGCHLPSSVFGESRYSPGSLQHGACFPDSNRAERHNLKSYKLGFKFSYDSYYVILSEVLPLSLLLESYWESLNVWDGLWWCTSSPSTGLKMWPKGHSFQIQELNLCWTWSMRDGRRDRGPLWRSLKAWSSRAWDFAASFKALNLPVCHWQNLSLREVCPS